MRSMTPDADTKGGKWPDGDAALLPRRCWNANSPTPAALPRFACGLSGEEPPADGVPVRCAASEWKGALPLPNLHKPTFAVGWRPAVPVALIGTDPESGAVPRGRQHQRAIRFRLSQERDSLPDRVCRTALLRQSMTILAMAPRIAGGMTASLSA